VKSKTCEMSLYPAQFMCIESGHNQQILHKRINNNNNNNNNKRKEQRSSDSTEENGNHTEETQHGPSQSPPNIGFGQENGKKLNKRIRWSREKMKEVLWCFTCIEEKTLQKTAILGTSHIIRKVLQCEA